MTEENISRLILMSINDSDIYYDDDSTGNREGSKLEMYVTLGMLGFLSMSGIIGNVLVLYVFTRQKQMLSSTVFILTLAGADLISSLVTMPLTIALELLHFRVDIDAICKLYHILATTAISFSASVMVAIAVDRYLCIVYPLKHTMTVRRAKVTVIIISIFATCIGLPSSLMYGVNKTYTKQMTTFPDLLITDNSTGHLLSLNTTDNASELSIAQIELILNETNITIHTFTINTGTCHKNELILNDTFFGIYQKIYSSFYALCAVIVIILYFIIYRSILIRRRRRFKLTSICCIILMPGQDVDNIKKEPDLLMEERNKSPSAASNETLCEILVKDQRNDSDINKITQEKRNSNAGKESLAGRIGISKAKLETLIMANIKNAIMLSIVAFIFIIAFVPAWLMALKVIPMNASVFYMYFTYNVANPIIYAFLNERFRNHMQKLLICRK